MSPREAACICIPRLCPGQALPKRIHFKFRTLHLIPWTPNSVVIKLAPRLESWQMKLKVIGAGLRPAFALASAHGRGADGFIKQERLVDFKKVALVAVNQ